MSTQKREWHVLATSEWQPIAEIPENKIFQHMLVENLGVSDVEIAFGVTTNPDVTIRASSVKSVSFERFLGKPYVRHTGGFNSNIIIRLW